MKMGFYLNLFKNNAVLPTKEISEKNNSNSILVPTVKIYINVCAYTF